jgi:hypothetical protein
MDGPIPAFLISFNRGGMLKQTIRGLERMAHPVTILVHDNGSTDASTVDVLNELAARNIKIYKHDPINTADDLICVNKSIEDYFRSHAYCPYIVSDCDIDMSIASPHTLNLYLDLLDKFPDAECVGPMLRIHDVPRSYRLYNQMMNRHVDQFWGKHPQWVETNFGRIAYIEAPFDTTLAIHRPGRTFARFRQGLRVYHPFEARHLDWYSDGRSIYRETSSSEISHWNNAKYTDDYKDVDILYDRFFIVKRRFRKLREYEVKIGRAKKYDSFILGIERMKSQLGVLIRSLRI